MQWQHLRLITSGSWVRNRRAAVFPKQKLDYPAIAPRKFPREPEKSLNCSGAKEQLWALLEFMEEDDTAETEKIFCTTDLREWNSIPVVWHGS